MTTRLCSFLTAAVVASIEMQCLAEPGGRRSNAADRRAEAADRREETSDRRSRRNSDDESDDDSDDDPDDEQMEFQTFVPAVPVFAAAPPAPPPNVPPRGAQASKLLAEQMNSLCWSMHNNYKNQEEFQEAYQEAYELLQLSQQIDKLLQAGKRGDELKDLLADFDGEIHHVEHHIIEFAGKNAPESEASKKMEAVEATLVALLTEFDIKRKPAGDGDDHEPHDGEKVPPGELSRMLDEQMNAFCWSLHRNHKSKAEFKEAYREAYELLQMAKEIDKNIQSGKTGEEVAEQLAEFDSEIHHVEEHVGEFTAGGKVKLGDNVDETVESFEEAEGTLHKLMNAFGLKRKHAEDHDHGSEKAAGHNHDHDEKKSKTDETVQEEPLPLAGHLAEKMALFCNSMSHNYKKNREYKEAYAEAYELYELAKKIEDAIKSGGITDDVREQLSEFDSETHHVEEHVKKFVADDGGSKDGPRRLGRKFDEVERTLHSLMESAGVKRKHVEEHDHDHEKDGAKKDKK